MLVCGLLGEKLGHSYSPQIHALLADYEYPLIEIKTEDLGDFIKNGNWNGLNVTIPHKKSVIEFCDELSAEAKITGSVNTLIKRADGTVFGDSTDVYGFKKLVEKSKIDVKGKKTLVLGSGGAAGAVVYALKQMGANVTVISRKGEDNYENIFKHYDAQVIVNTTPVGMFPNNNVSPIELKSFKNCQGVIDIIYNPEKTELLLQAEELNIPFINGLYMLVAQAKRSSEQFLKQQLDDKVIDNITRELEKQMRNIVLIGMPGSGKSTVAKALGKALQKEVLEADELIEQAAKKTIPQIFAQDGEEEFRKIETEILRELGKKSGVIISTGGGAVTKEENYKFLKQNGIVIWIKRDISLLACEGRPLSQKNNLAQMYEARKPLYSKFADFTVDNNKSIDKTVEQILTLI